MPLQGTFDVLGFDEVLTLLGAKRSTGRLHVRSSHLGANLYFDDGHLTGAESVDAPGVASGADAQSRLEDVCFEFLEAERGNFEFHPSPPGALPALGRFKVETVLARARKRVDAWREIQTVIPSLDAQPTVIAELAPDHITIDRSRWRVLNMIDGRRTIRGIARGLGLGDYDACRLMKSLVDDGLVEVHDHQPRASIPIAAGIDAAGTARFGDGEGIAGGGSGGAAQAPVAAGAAVGVGVGGDGDDASTAGMTKAVRARLRKGVRPVRPATAPPPA